MQVLDNPDNLLDSWETIKDAALPLPCTLDEALEFSRQKALLSALSRQVRNSRLENDIITEESCLTQFCAVYERFSKEYVYKVLKNGKLQQSKNS